MKKIILLIYCISFVMPAFSQSMFPQDNTDEQIQALKASGKLKSSQNTQIKIPQNYYPQPQINQNSEDLNKASTTLNQVNSIKSSVKSLLNY